LVLDVGDKKKLKLATLLTVSIYLLLLTQLETVNAAGTVYIKPDGTIEGTDSIQRNQDTYTFTADVSASLVIQKSFITVDGAGYTLSGTGTGVDLSNNREQNSSRPEIVNVTIKNLKIESFTTAINLQNSNNNTITANYLTQFETGIALRDGDFVITQNTLMNCPAPESHSYFIAITYTQTGEKTITKNNIFDGNSLIFSWAKTPLFSGNYWNNYNGTDNNSDGIGDTPYTILDSDQGTLVDNQPAMTPIDIPLFSEQQIPEFPPELIIPLFAAATFAALIYKKTKI
jgi:nitrous oxidase accessory protein NosD